MKNNMLYHRVEDMSDITLIDLTEAYKKELERRALKKIKEKEIDFFPSKKIKELTEQVEFWKNNYTRLSGEIKTGLDKNTEIKVLQQQVNFWKAGYNRLSSELSDILEHKNTTHDGNVELNLHKAKETIDILSDKLIEYDNQLKNIKGKGKGE